MRKLLIIPLLLITGAILAQGPLQNISMSPSSNFSYRDKRVVHNLIDKVNLKVIAPFYGTVDFNDATFISPEYFYDRSGSMMTITDIANNSFNNLFSNSDTLYLNFENSGYFNIWKKQLHLYSEFPLDKNFVAFHNPVVYIHDFQNSADYNGNGTTLLWPSDYDTIYIDELRNYTYQIQSYTPNSTSLTHVVAAVGVEVNVAMDNYVGFDSLQMLKIYPRDTGIPDDSLGAYYGIYHTASGITPQSGRDYFAYSEQGDMFLGGGARFDLVGRKMVIGGDITDFEQRTDDFAKSGTLVFPHYDNGEQEFLGVMGTSEGTSTIINVGGGNSQFNAATNIKFVTATNDITTTGTLTAEITTDGLEITSGAYKQVQLTGSLTDGAPTDAEIDAIVGDTPANMGAGWTVTIKDNDGTGLLYRVESDGTSWFYQVMTAAL